MIQWIWDNLALFKCLKGCHLERGHDLLPSLQPAVHYKVDLNYQKASLIEWKISKREVADSPSLDPFKCA